MGCAQTERTRAKVRQPRPCGPLRPAGLAPGGPSSMLVRAPLVAGDACETGWRPVRVLLHIRIADLGRRSGSPPRRCVPFRRPRCFSPWEPSDGRDRSLGHPAGPARYAADVRLCIGERPRLCYRRTSPGADNSKRGLPSARSVGSGTCVCPDRPIAAPLTASTIVGSRN